MKKFLRKTKVISGLGLIILLIVIIGIVIGCERKPITSEKTTATQKEPISQAEIEVSEEETTEQEASLEESTEEETSEEEPTEEEPGTLTSCIVFDNEEYCGMGEVPFAWSEEPEIGFNLEEGTKVYSPVDGLLSIYDFVLEKENENDQWSKGIEIVMWPIEEVMREFLFYDIVPEAFEKNEIVEIKWSEMPEGPRTEKMIKVKKGELIGTTTKGNPFGEKYNFVITILSTRDLPPYTPEYLPQFYSDMEFLKQYFPYIEYEE